MSQKFTNEQIQMILNSLNSAFDASIAQAQTNAPKEISELEIDLTEARSRNQALKVSFPFTSVYVEQASDTDTTINLIPNSIDSSANDVILSLRDSMSFDRGIRSAYLYWNAQPNKKIILKFFVTGKFQSGQLILNSNSTVLNASLGAITISYDVLGIFSSNRTLSYDTDFYVGANVLGMNDSQGKYNVKLEDINAFINGGFPMSYGNALMVPKGYKFRCLAISFKCEEVPDTPFTLNFGYTNKEVLNPKRMVFVDTADLNNVGDEEIIYDFTGIDQYIDEENVVYCGAEYVVTPPTKGKYKVAMIGIMEKVI